jgi:hypothetical protein
VEPDTTINEKIVRSLGELIDGVTPAAPDARTGRRRDTGIYRGGPAPGVPLLTSLDRLGGTRPPRSKSDLEAHILRNFIRYSRPFLNSPPVNDWELLVLAQHHGLPTRLLDWTYSPLVAAHFATLGREPRGDRCVWRLEWIPMHRKFDLPELALLIEDLEGIFGSERFTPWSLFDEDGRARDFACMIEPPSLSTRIVAQAAVFTLCSDKDVDFDRFLERHDLLGALTRYVIPEEELGRFRDQLDLASVDERRLFPDLDGLAKRLKRYYS